MKFPAGRWGNRRLSFHPAPATAPFRPFAAMVFAWEDDKALLGNIPGRGWCIPSGRVEPGEEPVEAALRETYEETGARIRDLRYLGNYQITDGRLVLYAAAYAARIETLDEIPEHSESLERRLVPMSELREIYHLWDDLTEMMFKHSREVLER